MIQPGETSTLYSKLLDPPSIHGVWNPVCGRIGVAPTVESDFGNPDDILTSRETKYKIPNVVSPGFYIIGVKYLYSCIPYTFSQPVPHPFVSTPRQMTFTFHWQ